MRAKDLMTTAVVTAPPETPVAALARLLADRGISAVPVVDDGGRLLGMVTEADLIRRLAGALDRPRGWLAGFLANGPDEAARYAKTHGASARDVMTTDLVTVGEEAKAEEIAALLEERRIRRVPVVREGFLVGIVSRADLLSAVLASSAAGAAPGAVPDAEIHRQLRKAMSQEPWAEANFVFPQVEGGVVRLHGFCRSREVERALCVLAGRVPGVRRVVVDLVPRPPLFGV